MNGSAWSVFATATIIGILLLAAGGAAWQQTAPSTSVSNETHTVDYNDTSSLNVSDVLSYSDSITVTANNKELTEGDDYEYNSTTGVITWLDTADTADGDTAYVTYSYQEPSETAKTTQGTMQPIEIVLGLAFFLTCFGALFRYTGLGGSGGGF